MRKRAKQQRKGPDVPGWKWFHNNQPCYNCRRKLQDNCLDVYEGKDGGEKAFRYICQSCGYDDIKYLKDLPRTLRDY